MPSVTCLRLSDVSVNCRVTCFQFPIQSPFLHISVARQHQQSGVQLALIRNVGHRTLPKFWVGTFPIRSVQKDFELILTVKMTTSHPVEGQFATEFSEICNHCGVMTA